MYDDALHSVRLWLEGLPLPVLGVVLAQDHRDLAQLGPVHAVGRRGDVPVVQQHAPALVAADPENKQITRPGVDKVKPKGWIKYSLQID